MRSNEPRWWKQAVFYQIYPRSFADSNGDGIGDLTGITERLDYLAGSPDSLGVNALWISPFYPSPMADFGYDVADYTDVDPRFGTLADFDRLLEGCHRRGLRVIIDLVLNHTSDEHPWFQEARRSRDNPYHDWYLWHAERRPNNWKSAFELSSAWWPNDATGEYYLGTFTRHQPEVNWRNPDLRAAMFDVMRFWLDRGVDGFRLDVVNWFLKDELMRSNPRSLRAVPDLFQHHVYDRNRPETIEICREMRALADSYGERVLVGEIYTQDVSIAASYYGPRGDGLHMAFNFDFLFQPWNAARFARSAREWYSALPEGAWPNFTLSNHDQPRHISRFGSGRTALARAKIAATMLLTLRGTPFLYYGEELGMENAKIPRDRLHDPLGKRAWPLPFGRDPERTPMQWDASPAAGFTTGTPWLPVHENYVERNVGLERGDPASLLTLYRHLLAVRSELEELRVGEIEFIAEGAHGLLAYRRFVPGEPREAVIVLNFAGRHRRGVPGLPCGSALFGTHREPGDSIDGGSLDLRPLEALLYRPSDAASTAAKA
ncbi:MAG: alpha-amylase family glycosyl hydrolase [Spirochaetota bacterium]